MEHKRVKGPRRGSQLSSARILLLTGAPGIGKTTLVRKVSEALGDRRLGGFTTDEIREGGRRRGFRILPFTGPERVLSHVDFRGPARVGRYGVDLAALDAAAEPALALDPAVDVYIVDEVGKMECLSERFVAAMRGVLDSDKQVVATVAQAGGGFMAEVKRRRDVELWAVTQQNRDTLPERILAWLRQG